jgi:hypothetical protein
LDEEPDSDAWGFDLVRPKPAAVQPAQSTSSITSWVGAVLAFIGREVVPRLAVSLLDVWDRRTRQLASSSSAVSSSPYKSYDTSVISNDQRGRRHRQRRRGLW